MSYTWRYTLRYTDLAGVCIWVVVSVVCVLLLSEVEE